MVCLGGRGNTDLQLKWICFVLHELKDTSLVTDKISTGVQHLSYGVLGPSILKDLYIKGNLASNGTYYQIVDSKSDHV